MHRTLRLVLALSIAALSACAGDSLRAIPAPVALPTKAEPAFQTVGYAALPPGVTMAAPSGPEELMIQLKHQFPELASDRASLELFGSQLILFGGAPYRRVSFSYRDLATTTMDGPCSQTIHLWILATGDISGTYVEQQVCPI